MASLPVTKKTTYIVGPGDPPGPDVTSGMQPSTCNGGIGFDLTPVGTTTGGATIGSDTQSDYHSAIANDQPPP